ncbi:MAG: signal recognition particle protein, partial [Sphingomonas sp.]|nr:signal recognition particle protein [Sphingomonas sp.]
YDQKQAEALEKKLRKNEFTLEDFRDQLQMVKKLGSMGDLLGMIPGMKKAQAAMASGAVDERILLRMDAMITSMTQKERSKPEILSAKRKIRIAKGSGTTVQDVNKLLKMHQEMSTAMKKIKKMGGMKGMMAMLGKGGMGGGMGGLGNAIGGPELGDMMGKAGGGLPGLGGGNPLGGMPKLPPGFENFINKKK